MKIPLVSYLIINLFFIASANGQQPFSSVKDPEITDFATVVQFLSSPDLEGRMTGAKGNQIAASYIASMMQQMKLSPLNPSDNAKPDITGYFQQYDLIQITHEGTKLIFKDTKKSLHDTFSIHTDFFTEEFFHNFRINGTANIDFSSVADNQTGNALNSDTISPKAIVLRETIEVYEKQSAAEKRNGSISSKSMASIRLDIHDNLDKDDFEKTGFKFEVRDTQNDVPVIYFNHEKSLKILDRYLSGKQPEKEEGKRSFKVLEVEIQGNTQLSPVVARNVIGMIPGRDSLTAIVIGAHYDHLGMDETGIYCGADDNASGVAGVISLAKMWYKSGEKPPCNLIFACWAGEETGKSGSSYFAGQIADPRTIRLYVNMDMISRSAPEDTFSRTLSIGFRAKDPQLKQLCSNENDQLPVPFLLDLWEVDGYTGSDYASFLPKDIPVLSFFSGFHPDYHTIRDTYEKIDLDKMERILYLVNHIIKRVLLN